MNKLKSRFNRQLSVLSAVLMLFGSFFIQSCSEDQVEEQPFLREFEESKLISFDEIDKMTQSTIEGEMIEEDDEAEFTGRTAYSTDFERRLYDFSAEVTRGANTGLMLEGSLRTRFTFYHSHYTIIRGRFITPDGRKGFLRGAIVSDGTVYLIFKAPGVGLIYGIGHEYDNGKLEGSFYLLGSNNRGLWEANLTDTIIPNKTIVDILVEDDRFETLVGAVVGADLAATLASEGPFTVFAPTDEAFAQLEAIPEGDVLKEVLLYHVLSGKFKLSKLLRKGAVTTIQGEEVTISIDEDNNIVLNDVVKLVQSNIKGTNGIIHVINAVLIPPSFTESNTIVDIAVGADNLTTLVSALQQADLVSALQGEGPFTVFAPTNNAFAALDALPEGDILKEVLLYHVASGNFDAATLLNKGVITTLQGEKVTIRQDVNGDVVLNDCVKVSVANIEASNGIIHIIDAVLIPNSFLPSIVDIAAGNSDFTTLVGALQAADLVGALQGEGPFTVFAPTNAAFDMLSSIPGGDALTEVLLYHVASGRKSADALLQAGKVTTLQGQDVTVELTESGDVVLNGMIRVIAADIKASNGIIHVIDAVLLPKPELGTIADIALATPQLSNLVGALVDADLVETLQGPGQFTVFAPLNSAFEALSAIPEGDALKEILLYHVVSGKFKSGRLVSLGEVETLQGGEIEIEKLDDNTIVINDEVKIVKRNIKASNGIIHLIDAVLIP